MDPISPSEEPVTVVAVPTDVKLPKNCKENRYYYKHREEILERKRQARLAKKGIDITKSEGIKVSTEERRKQKMEFLGLLKTDQ